jgi:hypothetical protein
MSNRISQMDARLVYQTGQAIVQKAGLSLAVVMLTQSTLRFEQQLIIGRTQYLWGILTTDLSATNQPPTNTEVRLRQQDSFITSNVAFRLGEPLTAVDPTYVDTTYPSPAIFVAAGEAAALEVLYKGQIKLTVNGTVIVPTLHTGRYRFVPTTQKVTAAANQNGIAYDAIDQATDGIMVCEPNLVLIGSKGNILETSYPAGVTVISAAGFTRMIFEFRGLLAQNSTIIT